MSVKKINNELYELLTLGEKFLKQYRKYKDDPVVKGQLEESFEDFGPMLNNEAIKLQLYGKLPAALAVFELLLEIMREMENRKGEGVILNNIGMVYRSWGRYQEALETYEEALGIRREVGDRAGEGTTLNNIGLLYINQELFPQAVPPLTTALDIFEELTSTIKSGARRQTFRGRHLTTTFSLVYNGLSWYFSDKPTEEKPADLLLQALKYLELGKARELVDKLDPRHQQLSFSELCPEFQQLINEEQRLTRDIYQLNQLLYQQQQAASVPLTRESTLQLKQLRSSLFEQLTQKTTRVKVLRKKIFDECADPGLVRQTAKYDP
ncbi:MAG: tetratricopeptide repeat protein, partial [Candidatus Heimdallarchaeota archaeon]|nr:tetratricopeptide repeat protein [Candidatus Heimdallarchaeota archaeon]